MQNKFAKKNFALVAISGEKEEIVKQFIARQRPKINYIVAAKGGRTSKAFGVDGIPMIFVLDSHGKVVWSGRNGREAEKVVQNELKLLGNAKPGPLIERRAAAELTRAEALVEAGKKDAALRALKNVVNQFKATKAAAKAKDLIAELNAAPKPGDDSAISD